MYSIAYHNTNLAVKLVCHYRSEECLLSYNCSTFCSSRSVLVEMVETFLACLSSVLGTTWGFRGAH